MKMIEGEFHPEMLLILPQIAVTHGQCGDISCPANHWRLTIGWIVGSLHFYF